MRKIVNNTSTTQLPIPKVDSLDRWIVRSESKRADWDTVFQGCGDNLSTGEVGNEQCFLVDFSAPIEDIRWIEAPEGFKRQSVKWNFSTPVYIKEGTIYGFNMPKGSYVDFYIGASAGYPYVLKSYDANFNVVKTVHVATDYTRFNHWVIHYHIEGSIPMGDELNTESAAEYPTYPFHIYEAVFTVPEITDWEQAHGHWALEIFRPGTVNL